MDRLPEIPGYRVVEKVGEGNFRTVYKAWKVIEPPKKEVYEDGDCTQIFPCALKIYKGQLPAGWNRELISLRDLEPHRNLERLYNFGPAEDGFYLETEFVDGRPLIEREFEQVCDRRKAVRKTFSRDLSVSDSIHITLELSKALEHLHKSGYIARDLSLSNVLVNDDLSVVKICDLGDMQRIGDRIERQEGPTTQGKELVNWNYLAPEIRREGGGTASEAVDAYSLGSVFLYMLSSKKDAPFDQSLSVAGLDCTDKVAYDRGLEERLDMIGFGGIDAQEQFGVKRILDRMLSFDPENRMVIQSALRRLKCELTNVHLCSRYTGKNVLGRLSENGFFYGSLFRIELGEKDGLVYYFDKVVRFDVFLPLYTVWADDQQIRRGFYLRSIELSDIEPERLTEAIKQHRGFIDALDSSVLSERGKKDGKLKEPSAYILQQIGDDSRVIKDETCVCKIEEDGGPIIIEFGKPILEIKGADVMEIIPFTFDDSVRIYPDKIDREKLVIEISTTKMENIAKMNGSPVVSKFAESESVKISDVLEKSVAHY